MKLVRILLVVGLGFCVTGIMGWQSNAEAKGEPIFFGEVIPLTGGSAFTGADMARGTDVAVEEINESGGVLGRTLKIIREDSESRPAGGITAVHKLVDVNRVPIMLGAYSSSVSLAIGEYTNKKKTIHLSWPTSTAAREVGPYFFHVGPLAEHSAGATVRLGMENSPKTFAVIVPNNAYGLDMEKYFKIGIKQLGGQVKETIEYERGKTSYRSELQTLKDVDCIIITAYGTEAKMLFKNMYEMGISAEKGIYAAFLSMNVDVAIPETVDGVKGTAIATHGAGADIFINRYKEKYGFDPKTPYSPVQYDAVWLAAMAMNFAHSTDADDIRGALYKIAPHYASASSGGNKGFDKDGMQKECCLETQIFDVDKKKRLLYTSKTIGKSVVCWSID